jgi:hypothetical protein
LLIRPTRIIVGEVGGVEAHDMLLEMQLYLAQIRELRTALSAE